MAAVHFIVGVCISVAVFIILFFPLMQYVLVHQEVFTLKG